MIYVNEGLRAYFSFYLNSFNQYIAIESNLHKLSQAQILMFLQEFKNFYLIYGFQE